MHAPLPRLFVSYNDEGAPIRHKLARQAAAAGVPVWEASMAELDTADLPVGAQSIAVSPVFMQAGRAAEELLPARLKEAFARRGESPALKMGSVWGASPSLAAETARALSSRLAAEAAVLIVAHGRKGSVQSEEPKRFAAGLSELLSGREVRLAWFGAEPSAGAAFSSLLADEVLVLPFLAGKGMHYRNDMPTVNQAVQWGKRMTLLPPLGDLLA